MRRKKRKPLKLLHVPVVHAEEVYDASATTRREIATKQALEIAAALKATQQKRRAKALEENARRLAREAEWKRRNETPGLFDDWEPGEPPA